MDKFSCVALIFLQALLQVLVVHGSAECSVQHADCIVPQPLLTLKDTNLAEIVQDIQCEIGCIAEVSIIYILNVEHYTTPY